MPVLVAQESIEDFTTRLIRDGHMVGPSPQYRVSRATAAKVLGVSEKTLRNRASAGLRPDYYRVMGRVFYAARELLDFMETRPDDLAA